MEQSLKEGERGRGERGEKGEGGSERGGESAQCTIT